MAEGEEPGAEEDAGEGVEGVLGEEGEEDGDEPQCFQEGVRGSARECKGVRG